MSLPFYQPGNENPDEKKQAVELTVIILKDAEAHIEDFEDEEDFSDSHAVIELLRENLKLWKEEQEEEM